MFALLEGRNKELPGVAEVLRATELEEKGVQLSITEGGKKGTRKVTASCG